MVSPQDGATRENETGTIAVAFQGSDAKEEAERIHLELQTSGLAVEPLAEVGQDEARLGAAEIIITIVVTAAAKAVLTTSLKYLEEYLRSRVEGGGANVNVQLVVKAPEKPRPHRFLLNLRQASGQTVIAFCENIRQAVAKL